MNKKSIDKIIRIIKVIKKQKNKNNFILPFTVVFLAMFLIFFSLQTNSFANTVFASKNSKQANSKHVRKLFVDPTTMNVSFDFQNASLVDVIRMIAKVSNMNVLIGSNVKGTVTMKMHNVPLKRRIFCYIGRIRAGNS